MSDRINPFALFDSSIAIDRLNGIPLAATELAQHQHAKVDNIISLIARAEGHVKAPPRLEEATRQAIDANFKRAELGEAVLL